VVSRDLVLPDLPEGAGTRCVALLPAAAAAAVVWWLIAFGGFGVSERQERRVVAVLVVFRFLVLGFSNAFGSEGGFSSPVTAYG